MANIIYRGVDKRRKETAIWGKEGNLSDPKYGPVKNKVGVNPTFEFKFNETNGSHLRTKMRKMYKNGSGIWP